MTASLSGDRLLPMGTRFQRGVRLGAALATALPAPRELWEEHDLVTVPSTSTLGDPADLEVSMLVDRPKLIRATPSRS
jgi:hypothetical protein